MKAKFIKVVLATSIAAVTLVGCAAGGPSGQPTASPSSTQSPSSSPIASPQSPTQAWSSFAEIADASCYKAYEGLVEEDIDGPNTGKLKIRLTWEQAGENSLVYQMPDGSTDFLQYIEFYSCEAWHLMTNVEGFEGSVPPFSAGLPLQVTFDHLTGKYQTTQLDQDGNQKTLRYTIDDGVFSLVENLTEGSKTTLTFGLPNASMTQIVNDFYAAWNSG